MNSAGANVETPIFSRDTFASTLSAQSAKLFSRLIHTPLISMHLRDGAITGAEIDSTATTRISNLEELEKQLTALSKCLEVKDVMSTTAAAPPVPLDGNSNRHTTGDSSTHVTDGRGMFSTTLERSPEYGQLRHDHQQEKSCSNNNEGGEGKGRKTVTISASNKRPPPPSPTSLAPTPKWREQRCCCGGQRPPPRQGPAGGNGSERECQLAGDAATVADEGPVVGSFSIQLPSFFARAGAKGAVSCLGHAEHASSNSCKGKSSTKGIAGQWARRVSLVSPSVPAASAQGRGAASASSKQVRLPKVVVQTFSIGGALDAIHQHQTSCPHTATTALTGTPRTCLLFRSDGVSVTLAAAAEASPEEQQQPQQQRAEIKGNGVALVAGNAEGGPLSFFHNNEHTLPATGNGAAGSAEPLHGAGGGSPVAAGGRSPRGQRCQSIIVNLTTATPDDATHLTLPSTQRRLPAAGSDNTQGRKNKGQDEEKTDALECERSLSYSGKAREEEKGDDGGHRTATLSPPPPPPPREAHESESDHSDSDNAPRQAGRASTTAPSPVEKTKEWLLESEATEDTHGGRRRVVVDEEVFMASSSSTSRDSPLPTTRHQDVRLSGGEHEPTSGGAAAGARPPPRPSAGAVATATLPPPASWPGSAGAAGAATNNLSCPPCQHGSSVHNDPYVLCDPDYEDLAGWLSILVWTRLEVIYLLRELSSVQAMAAWSAWYWAWAQDHPRQASVHFALGSTQFWRSAIKGDFASPIALVHFSASGHMMALRTLFRLIVSCVGAAHGALESLNSVVAEIQREAEVTTSDVAAAAAALRTWKGPSARHVSKQHNSTAASNAATSFALFCHYGGAAPAAAPPAAPADKKAGEAAKAGMSYSHVVDGMTLLPRGGDGGNSSPLGRQLSLAASMRYPASVSFHNAQQFALSASSPAAAPPVLIPFRNANDSVSQSALAQPTTTADGVGGAPAVTPILFSAQSAEVSTAAAGHGDPQTHHWDTFSNATTGDLAAAVLETTGSEDDFGLPPCQTYNAVEALRVAVLSTITKLSAMVGSQGLPSQIAQEEIASGGDDWLSRPLGEDAACGQDNDDQQSNRRASELGLDEAFTAGGIRGLAHTMKTAAAARSNLASRHWTGGSGGSGGSRGGGGGAAAAALASPQLRLGEYQNARKATLLEGVVALRVCVSRTRFFLQSMADLIRDVHHPPATRHWRRATIAAVTIVPAFTWLYTKSPADVVRLVKAAATRAAQILQSYVLVPAQQLHEAIFYVRPGVAERRTAFDRDAQALANIVRDYHEDYYPNSTQEELDRLHDYSLDCMRRGVADDRGFGLIEQHYRNAVKHPIRTAIFGDLPRILLIQLSFQTLEMSRVTNGMDEVLEGNDLNFKVMALMPVFAAVALGSLWTLMKWRATMVPVRQRMKLIWRSIYRVVTLAEGESAMAMAGGAGGGMRYPPQYSSPSPPQHHSRRRRSSRPREQQHQSHQPQHEARSRRERHRLQTQCVREAVRTMDLPLRRRTSSPKAKQRSDSHGGNEKEEGMGGMPDGQRPEHELHEDNDGNLISSNSIPDRHHKGNAEVTNASIATAAYRTSSSGRRYSSNKPNSSPAAAGQQGSNSFLGRSANSDSGNGNGDEGSNSRAGNHTRLSPQQQQQQQRPTTRFEGDGSDRRNGSVRLEAQRPPSLRLHASDLHDREPTSRSSHQHHTMDELSEEEGRGEDSGSESESENDRGDGEYRVDGGWPPSGYRGNVSPSPHRREGGGGGAPGVPVAAIDLDTVSSVRVLNNYEQGMVLVLVHLMRSLANEYFRSYVFYHELMEDLDDLESMQCSRHRRLETLRRMSYTHSFLK